MGAEERKSSYSGVNPAIQSRGIGCGLHNFPNIAGDDGKGRQRHLAAEESFKRVQYDNAGSGHPASPANYNGSGLLSKKGSLSTAQLITQAYNEGFTDGKREGLIEAENSWHELSAKKLEPVMKSFSEALLQFETIRAETYRQIEGEVVELSLAIARKVIGQQTTVDNTIVLEAVRNALAKVEEPGRIKIKINPADLAFVTENQSILSEMIENSENVRFEAVESIQIGGCVIETDLGEIDARIEKQLQAVDASFRKTLESA